MSDLDPETAMTVGGWGPRHARVLDVATLGDHAAALIDANGDGADVNVDLYRRRPDGSWLLLASGNGSQSADGVRAVWTDDDRVELTHVEA